MASANVSALIEDELARLRREGGSASLTLSTTPDHKVDLGSLADLGPQFKLLTPLLSLLPNPIVRVSTAVLPSGPRGLGMSVSIARDRAVMERAVFWQGDFDPHWKREGPALDSAAGEEETKKPTADDPAALQLLATVAAAWLQYTLPMSAKARAAARLFTPHVRSYTRYAAGVMWDLHGDPKRARAMYVKALDIDPSNTGALVNMSSLDYRASKWLRAAERLERVPGLIEQRARALGGRARLPQQVAEQLRLVGREGHQRDRQWYRAHYLAGITWLHHHVELRLAAPSGTTDEAGDAVAPQQALKSAIAAATLLTRTAADVLDELEREHDERADALRQFLSLLEQAGAVVLADAYRYDAHLDRGTTGTRPDTGAAAAAPARREESTTVSSGLKAGKNPLPADSREALRSAIDGKDAIGLIAYVTGGGKKRGLASQVHYNLGCYYGGPATGDAPADPERARRHLQFAFENRQVAQHAKLDPTLALFRKACRDEFLKLVRDAGVSTDDLEAAGTLARLKRQLKRWFPKDA